MDGTSFRGNFFLEKGFWITLLYMQLHQSTSAFSTTNK